MKMRKLLAASAALSVLAGVANAAPPPASAFGRVPAIVDADISPNGQHVAILGGASSQRFVSVATIDQPNLPILQLGDVETTRLRWAGDDHVIADIAFWHSSGPRTAYRIERHVAVSTQAKAVSRFFDNVQAEAYLVGGQPVLGVTHEPTARVFVKDLGTSGGAFGTADTRMKRKGVETSAVLAVWSIDPATGNGKLVERGDPDTSGWDLDLTGTPRVRYDTDDTNQRSSVYGRAKGKSGWTALWNEGPGDEDIVFYGYSDPDDALYFAKDGKLLKRRLADGAVETVGEGGPSLSLIWDSYRNTPVGISTGAERPTIQWLDADVGAAHGALSRAFKGKDVWFASWSKDRTRFVARVAAPNAPPVWYLYDRARKEVSPLGDEYPELKGVEFGPTRWLTYKARDGLEIAAYLTLPPGGAPAGGKRPLIVLPHGGPHARDTYDFDFIAQFLATRGYAVLQPQFRGSWGFGHAFQEAGKGEWGGKMQTDLLDGVAALAAAGEIDPAKVCIVGGSYGGYAALAGVTLNPDAYRCAVSIAGVSHLGQFLNDESRLYGKDSGAFSAWREELAGASGTKLTEVSPASHAGRAKAPVLLIHGDQDTVVLPNQSDLMAQRLKDAGKPVEYVVLAGENHYLTKSTTRTQTLEAIEAFLAKNLPVN